MKSIITRSKELSHLFSTNHSVLLGDSGIEIIPIDFIQNSGTTEIDSIQNAMPFTDFCNTSDSQISENFEFKYYVFNPKGRIKSKNAILLLHGLNERTWDKYLLWAEELASAADSPVILFPLAFHINRTPCDWFSPRWIMPWASKRRSELTDIRSSSFFNYALSARLSKCPERFYISGKESVFNICQMLSEIRSGDNPYLAADSTINLFAYSIGAFLSQILLLSNPFDYFKRSKLFMFCGGSVFEQMNGIAKDIMDEKAFNAIHNYYMHDFKANEKDRVESAFGTMLFSKKKKEKREFFFKKNSDRVKIVTMKQDIVIPTIGAISAVGYSNREMVEELDFPFIYSHQIPFPINGSVDDSLLLPSFKMIFEKAEMFLCP